MENPLKTLGVKTLKCQECGKMYPLSEFYEIAAEVGKPGVGFPLYADLLRCISCWCKKYSKKVEGG